MKATLLLADAAQTDRATQRAHVLGLGWMGTRTPTPAMALLLLIECPWDETNRVHDLQIALVDADGNLVSFKSDDAGEPIAAVNMAVQVEATRPLGAPPGITLRLPPQVINLAPGMPLIPGQYEFRLGVNGEPADGSISFTVAARPQRRRRQ